MASDKLSQLPNELKEMLLIYLDTSSLTTFLSVNSNWNAFIKSSSKLMYLMKPSFQMLRLQQQETNDEKSILVDLLYSQTGSTLLKLKINEESIDICHYGLKGISLALVLFLQEQLGLPEVATTEYSGDYFTASQLSLPVSSTCCGLKMIMDFIMSRCRFDMFHMDFHDPAINQLVTSSFQRHKMTVNHLRVSEVRDKTAQNLLYQSGCKKLSIVPGRGQKPLQMTENIISEKLPLKINSLELQVCDFKSFEYYLETRLMHHKEIDLCSVRCYAELLESEGSRLEKWQNVMGKLEKKINMIVDVEKISGKFVNISVRCTHIN